MHLYCTSQVRDYEIWKRIFDSHQHLHVEAGLKLLHLWRSKDDPNFIVFVFDVEDRARAQAFLDDPVSAQAGEDAGVVGGDFHFMELTRGYG